jgi:hypothetical protein
MQEEGKLPYRTPPLLVANAPDWADAHRVLGDPEQIAPVDNQAFGKRLADIIVRAVGGSAKRRMGNGDS